MIQTKAKIVYNKKLAKAHFLMRIESKEIAKTALPGQFVHIRVSEKTNPLLRRPFSFNRIDGKYFEVLYKVVGKGTQILSEKKQGEKLDVIGPLGNTFELPEEDFMPILVAGGMGVAPLLFLAEKIMECKAPCLAGRQESAKRKAIAIIGAKTKAEILCSKQLKELGFDVKIATEDGSAGKKALATDLLWTTDYLPRAKSRGGPSTIYACGPKPMLKEVASIAKEKDIKAQVLMEEVMACGVGACLGCAVNTKKGIKMVCKDGPVFNADEILW